MSRLALINKNLKRQAVRDKYAQQIKRLKNILQMSKEILKIEDDTQKQKRENMLKGVIKSCKILNPRYIKALVSNSIQNFSFLIMLIFQKLPRNAFANRVRKRCLITGRPRGLRNQVSGMFIRRSARDLLLFGYTKV